MYKIIYHKNKGSVQYNNMFIFKIKNLWKKKSAKDQEFCEQEFGRLDVYLDDSF